MLKMLQDRLGGANNRLQGRTDLLEAVCAASALTAAANGIKDQEIDATVKAVTSNEALNTAFQARQIEGCIQRMLERAAGGRVGQMGLYKEIDDVAGNADDAELVLLSAIDVAESEGDEGDKIDADERKVLEKIAGRLGLKLSNYLDD